ncbi:MAG: STAS/SEC14 domain-containing protein [Pseudomonadota bacterium]
MIEVETIADGQIALRVKGKLEKEDIASAIEALQDARAAYGNVNILVDLTGFAGMTLEALFADIGYGINHLSELKHFKRIAVITDADWIEALIWVENRLLRQTDMRAFEAEDAELARRFVDGEDIPEKDYEPSVIRLAGNRPDLIVFEVRDKMRNADAQAVFGFLDAAYQAYGKVDLMVIIREFEGFELGILFDAQNWKSKSTSIARINKYAVVGGPSFVAATAQFIGSFLPVDIKTFVLDDVEDAWAWVGARPLLT